MKWVGNQIQAGSRRVHDSILYYFFIFDDNFVLDEFCELERIANMNSVLNISLRESLAKYLQNFQLSRAIQNAAAAPGRRFLLTTDSKATSNIKEDCNCKLAQTLDYKKKL